MARNPSMFSSDRMDWETPLWLFDSLHEEFAFTLDGAASAHNAKCDLYYDAEQNSLNCAWTGRVWLNPPFGNDLTAFIAKAAEAVTKRAECVVCLVPVRTDTRWWHQSAMKAAEIRLLNRRIQFRGSTNKAPFAVCILVFRKGHTGLPVLRTVDVPLGVK